MFKDYFEEDIEEIATQPYTISYARAFYPTRKARKAPPKVVSSSVKGGLVRSYKEIPLWTKEQQKALDDVDKVIAREIKK